MYQLTTKIKIMLEQQLEQIGKAFIQKVLEGDYQITETSDGMCKVLVNQKYELLLFHSVYSKHAFIHEIVESPLASHIIMTEEEKAKAYTTLMPNIEKYMAEKGKAEKLAEIARLQAEIENL